MNNNTSDPAYGSNASAYGAVPPPPPPPSGHHSQNKILITLASVAVLLLIGAGIVTLALLQPSSKTVLEEAFDTCDGGQAFDYVLANAIDLDEMNEAQDDDTSDVAFEELEGRLTLKDDGQTLAVQTLPEDEDIIGVSALAMNCVLLSIDAPEWVADSVGTTRALDGRQDSEWDDFIAEYSYHPDNGLNMTIRSK